MSASYKYVLGDSSREAGRLRAQARLWDPTAHALFDRLGVANGWRVLELGPGRGSLHAELRRRVGGPIDAVEHSPEFARRLISRCRRDRWGMGRIWQADVRDVRLPRAHYDLIFARWVLLFVPDPLAQIRKLARALKPGGVIALEEYHRETWALAPRPPEWFDFLEADRAFFASQGGDASLGGLLPTFYRRAGLDVVDVTPTVKTGHPGSPTWRWLADYSLSVLDRYAAIPPFTPDKANHLKRWLHAMERDRSSVVIGPAMLDVVGRRPRRAGKA